MVITVVVLAAALAACGTRPAHVNQGAPHHGPEHAVRTTTFRLPAGILGLTTGGGAAWGAVTTSSWSRIRDRSGLPVEGSGSEGGLSRAPGWGELVRR